MPRLYTHTVRGKSFWAIVDWGYSQTNIRGNLQEELLKGESAQTGPCHKVRNSMVKSKCVIVTYLSFHILK